MLALYVWDRELSATFFSDIAVLEVPLRNAIDREFVHYLGSASHLQHDLWDARTRRRITQVLARIAFFNGRL
jgi:abortive infection bacteriophage resistance protein